MSSTGLKHFLKRIVVPALAITLVLGTGAMAQGHGDGGDGDHGGGDHDGGGGHGAPEIDPSLATAGIILLAGGTLVLTGRRRPSTT